MSGLSASMVRTLTDVDHLDHEALVAFPARDSPTIAGVARFIRIPGLRATADLAITVADEWHRRGMGTTAEIEFFDNRTPGGPPSNTSPPAAASPRVSR